MQRILIIGAGSMGCLFAARVAESGAEVMLIDVDAVRIAAIAQGGIDLTDDNGTRTIAVKAGTAEEATGPFDLIFLFTKGMHSRVAIRSVAHLATADGPYVLSLQNGLGNPEIIAERFPPEKVLKGIAALPADLEGANKVSSHGTGYLEIGSMTPEGADAARAAADLLGRSGFDARYHAHVDIAIWEKVAFNAALNSIATVTEQTNAGMNNAPGRRIACALIGEVVATANACGVPVDRAKVDEAVDFALKHHGAHQASMLQDRLAGRQTEIESINGAVCARARAVGVPTPVTETMADLVRLIELAGS